MIANQSLQTKPWYVHPYRPDNMQPSKQRKTNVAKLPKGTPPNAFPFLYSLSHPPKRPHREKKVTASNDRNECGHFETITTLAESLYI
jgi:hypothetical protein